MKKKMERRRFCQIVEIFQGMNNPHTNEVWVGRLVQMYVGLFILAGCTTTPLPVVSPNLDIAVPEQWVRQADSSEPIEAWWRTFGDLELNALITEAIETNHDLKAAAARIDIAEAELRVAGADRLPQIEAGFDALRQRQNIIVPGSSLPGGSSFVTNRFGLSFDVSWEIDLWGRIRSGMQAVLADMEARRADYAAAALSIAAQTAKTWFTITEARLQVELAHVTVKSFDETARRANDRVSAGVNPPTDGHLATENYASAKARLQQRKEIYERAVRQLEILLGRYPAGTLSGAEILPEISMPVPAGIPAEILQRRPDLQAAERLTAGAGGRVQSAKAALLPRLSLTASGGTASNELRNILSGDFLIWTIAGNLVQPVFQGGRLRARIDQAEGQFKEAAENFAQQTLTAFSEVETILVVERVLADQEQALGEASTSARAAVEVAENRYAQGVETFLVVLESQRRAFNAGSALLEVKRKRLETRLDLFLALGGGFFALNEVARQGIHQAAQGAVIP